MASQKGEADGFSVELLTAVAQVMGHQPEFKVAPWQQIKQELAEGKLDVLPLVGRTPEREAIFDFTVPYLTLHGTIVVRDGEKSIVNIDDLRGKRVGVMAGDIAEEFVQRNVLADNLTSTNTYNEVFRLLDTGELDAVVIQRLVALRLIEDMGLDNLRTLGNIKEFDQQFTFAVTEGNKQLLAELNEGLSRVIANGSYEKIRNKWLGILEREPPSQQVANTILIVVVTLIIALLVARVWQRTLIRKVEQSTRELKLYKEELEQRVDERTSELMAERHKLYQAQKIAHVGSYRWEIGDDVTIWSDELYEIVGHPKHDFIPTYENYVASIHPEDREYFTTITQTVMQRKGLYSAEYRVVRPDGAVRNVIEKGEVKLKASGEIHSLTGTIQDITELMQTELALRESEKRYRSLLESSPDWVWEVDANAAYTYASPRVYELLGYTPEEVIGKTPFDLMPAEEVERVGGIFGEIVAARRPFNNLENTNRHKNGQTVVLETSGSPILSEQGELLGYRGVDRDITQRNQNESELRAERDFNNTVLESAGNVIVILDLKGNFVRFNRAAEELTQYDSEEVLGRAIWELVIPEEQKNGVKTVFENLCHGDIDMAGQYENEWVCRDGSRRMLQWNNSVLHDKNGVIEYIIALGYDITERKQLEASLREQEQELAQIIDHLPSMIYLKHAGDLSYARINNVYEKLTGISRQEILGRDDHEFFPKEQADFFNERDRIVLLSGELDDTPEEPIDTPDGTRILHTRKVAIHDENGKPKYLLGVSDDITERKEAGKERERLQRELQQAQKMESLGQLTGGIAHDFNNLLGIINGYSGLALASCQARGEEKLAEYMGHLQEAGGRATNLVSQMLAFSRSDVADDLPVQFAPLLKADIKMLRSTLPSTIEMTTEIEPGLPSVVMNPTQLHQILMNLSINGRDAMQGVGKLSIKLGWARDLDTESPISHKPVKGDWVELSVSDTGSGIDAQTVKSIFNPFFTTKEVGKGTGMGLSVIYGIMENHDGHILLESELGKGSTFRMLFPPQLAESDTTQVGIDRQLEIPDGDGSEILVVDDELSLGIFMAELLKSHGYKAISAGDGIEALELFEQQPDRFKMVITDQTMPKMTGTEMIAKVRQIRPQLPAILCTGYSDKIDAKGAEEIDIPFFEKPVDEQRLMIKVAELLKLSRDNSGGEA